MEKKDIREDVKVYEIGYVIAPSVPEEKVGHEVGIIKEVISKNGGEFISDEYPRLRPLAYTMAKQIDGVRHKFDEGYFGWVKFDITPESINAVKVSMDTQKNVIRYLLITTVRENTYLGQKVAVIKEEKAEVPATEAEVPVEASAEEIDKTIDDMVKEA